MKEVTVISIWNKKEQFQHFVKVLNEQRNIKINLISIDNSANKYRGAREAYNSVLSQINTEIVFFMHPDIVFCDEMNMAYMLESVENLNEYGVVGVAGCKEGRQWNLLSNIIHGKMKENAGINVNEIEEVQTVDECLFIMRKQYLEEEGFSELLGWHLYAVEQCLIAIEKGYKNYIIPVKVWHQSSGGSLDPSYMKCLSEIIKMFGERHMYINTTVKQWVTKGVLARLYREYYYLKQIMKKYIVYMSRRFR